MNGVSLAPWDRLSAYNAPVETTVQPTGVPVRVLPGDPMRVLIVFSMSGVLNAGLSITYPIPIAFATINPSALLPYIAVSTNPAVNSLSGFPLSPLGVPLVIDARQWGPAVAAPWYAFGSGAVFPTLSILTISMRVWPETDTTPSLIKDADDGKFRNAAPRRANRTGGNRVYGNRWTQFPAASPYDLSGI